MTFLKGGKIQILNKFDYHVTGIVTQDKFDALLYFCNNASVAQLVEHPTSMPSMEGSGPLADGLGFFEIFWPVILLV